METRSIEEFIKYVKNRAYDLEVRHAKGMHPLLASVYFTIGGQRQAVFEGQNRKSLSSLGQKVVYQNPEFVEVHFAINQHSESHQYTYKMNAQPNPFNNERGNDFYSLPTKNNDNSSFSGLGRIDPVSVESIVNKRLEEERKERDLKELKAKLNESNEKLTEKTKAIEGLEAEIEGKKQEIEDLQKVIESKKNFKYYAGLTGDILQSFGIKKEVIGKPLAGLLTGESQEETKAIAASNQQQDTSGIVEEAEATQPDQRAEMIRLFNTYFDTIDTPSLAKLFEIFSYIEDDTDNAERILTYLKQKKQ